MTGSTAPETGADRLGLRVLDLDECVERLTRTPVGRIAFVSSGDLVVFPVNHAVDGMSVVFRTRFGSKMEVATSAGHVAFEVDSYDPAAETGWSVVLKGRAELVYDEADTARYDGLGLRSWADQEGRGQWVRIRPDEVSGREIGG